MVMKIERKIIVKYRNKKYYILYLKSQLIYLLYFIKLKILTDDIITMTNNLTELKTNKHIKIKLFFIRIKLKVYIM